MKSSLPNPATSSPSFRRRRTIWFFVFVLTALCFFLYKSDLLPGASFIPSYPLSFGGFKAPPVSEIHGLQHFVINSQDSLSHSILIAAHHDEGGLKLNPKEEIDLSVYSSFNSDEDWEKHVKVLEKQYPVVVFSKTYCPFSRKAKALLESYQLEPAPKIIEVDLREDSEILKVILTRLTAHSTYPNVMLRGKTIGGADKIQELHEQGQLKGVFESAGVKVRGRVEMNKV